MPFTFSHPAIILPLAKLQSNRISATGLIIGSMAPDFEFFIRMKLERVHGHSIAGVFYWDLPLTIILSFLFQLIVRDALIKYSPDPIKRNFKKFIGLNWIKWVKKYWYVLIYSSLLGIFSHLFWDAWTHESGFFAQRIPFLLQDSFIFLWSIPNYLIAQLLSSLFGAIVIGIVLVFPNQKKYNAEDWKNMVYYWGIVSFTLLTVLLFKNINSMGDLLATTISGGLIGLLVAPWILKKILRNEKG